MPNHTRLLLLLPFFLSTGLAAQDSVFTRADTLRGSNTPARAWWDVTFYDLHVRINPADSTVQGCTMPRRTSWLALPEAPRAIVSNRREWRFPPREANPQGVEELSSGAYRFSTV